MIKRLAIFIDYQNFLGAVNIQVDKELRNLSKNSKELIPKENLTKPNKEKFDKLIKIKGNSKYIKHLHIDVWKKLNKYIINEVAKKYNVDIDHQGTYITLGIRVNTHQTEEDEKKKKILEDIASLDGYVVKFELTRDDVDIKRDSLMKAYVGDYGVDARIVCQMLLGAFKDNYDLAVLISDDQDFIPAIELIQNEYGKKIIHLGIKFRNKAASFSSIPFSPLYNKHILKIN